MSFLVFAADVAQFGLSVEIDRQLLPRLHHRLLALSEEV
jgi:hypothetical protein